MYHQAVVPHLARFERGADSAYLYVRRSDHPDVDS